MQIKICDHCHRVEPKITLNRRAWVMPSNDPAILGAEFLEAELCDKCLLQIEKKLSNFIGKEGD
jgi:hypothetical protein